jgi:caffeoyl-CoA O-methyltransferase
MLKKATIGLVALAILAATAYIVFAQVNAGPATPADRDQVRRVVPERWAQAGPPGRGPGGRGPALQISDKPPIPKTEAEKTILAVLDDMHQNAPRGMASVSPSDGRLLRVLTEAVGAKHVVEIGTSHGYSAIWFCLALRTTGGRLTTHEIDPQRAALARSNFERAGVADLVTLVEGDAHETVTRIEEPIDILFLDADKPGYVDYLSKLLPLVRPGGLVIAHNMHSPPPDPGYVEAITTNPDLETVLVDMQGAGIGVTLKKRG